MVDGNEDEVGAAVDGAIVTAMAVQRADDLIQKRDLLTLNPWTSTNVGHVRCGIDKLSYHAVARAPAVSLYGIFGTSGCGYSTESENFIDAVRGDFSAGKGTWCINEGQASALLALRRFVDVLLTIVGVHLTH